MNKTTKFTTAIGLEVHIELSAKTKIFCGCSAAFTKKPNSQVCPVCAGMPGTLPVLNKKVLEYAILAGLATNCDITRISRFDRKNYFYADNPQNYQISQLYLPICQNGYVELPDTGKKVRIREIHMEEDAGKLFHSEEQNISLVDLNRAGVPLIEIVTMPDMTDAGEVIAFLEKLRLIILYLGISDCKMQEGSMRVDVNLSVAPEGSGELGVRTEMKNLNSFQAVSHAIEAEKNRQTELLSGGGTVVMQTRRWDEKSGTSYPMRGKEEVRDYRYFPDPDLMPVIVSGELIDSLKESLPEFRDEKKSRFMSQYLLPEYDADILTREPETAGFFEQTVKLCGEPKRVSNYLMGDLIRLKRQEGSSSASIPFSPAHLASLVTLTKEGRINSSVAAQVFEKMYHEDTDPESYIKENGLETVSDEDALLSVVKAVIEENEKAVEDFRSGKQKAIGFLVGMAMKKTAGKADPELLRTLITKAL